MTSQRGFMGTVGILSAVAGASCTSVLGDFEVGAEGGDAGGAVREGGAGGDAPAPVPKCSDVGAPNCGTHGRCQDSSGTAVCACDAAYTGDTCGACATGFQDNDHNGTCLPSCAGNPLTCPAHQTCNDASGTAACGCVMGYTLQGAACVWSGGLLDPGLRNMPVGAWQVSNGAVLDAMNAGSEEPGAVHFDAPTTCKTLGQVSQTFAMPSYASAEPLTLRVVVQSTCSGQDCGAAGLSTLWNGGGYSELIPQTLGYGTVKQCLGERAYGGNVQLTFQATADACYAGADATFDVLLDHADIEPDATCPALGTIPNADFEMASSWTSTGFGGTAEIQAGTGVGNSRAGHLHTLANSTNQPQLTSLVSVPGASVPNLALKLTYNGGVFHAGDLHVTLGGEGSLIGFGSTGGWHVGDLPAASNMQARVCIPEWAKGTVLPLTFNLRADYATSFARDYVFDNLSFGSDPTCPSTALVLQGDFEGDQITSWTFLAADPAVAAPTTGQAHAGSQSLEVGVSAYCQSPAALQSVTVPSSAGTAGPAVKYYYLLPTLSGAPSFYAAVGDASTTFTQTATWKPMTACLDPKRTGQPVFVAFHGQAAGACAQPGFAKQSVFIDDVTVTTDASCPSQ